MLEEIDDLRQVRPAPRSNKKSNGLSAIAAASAGAESDSEMSISESVIVSCLVILLPPKKQQPLTFQKV